MQLARMMICSLPFQRWLRGDLCNSESPRFHKLGLFGACDLGARCGLLRISQVILPAGDLIAGSEENMIFHVQNSPTIPHIHEFACR